MMIPAVLFTFNWWLLVFIMIFPFLIWLKVVDKSRLLEIMIVGLFAGIIASFLDMVGVSFSLWSYGNQLLQVLPMLSPVNFSLLPCIYMLVYQRIPSWKPYVIILTLLAAFGAFVAEPVFSWLHIYHVITWKYSYSFPIYIAIGIGIKALTEKLAVIQQQKRQE
ncbi:CBO0543 family protein [Bacillus piscicola]|uniref:CBO0543 family protein n=1 Tax=Bacillus piscicola TaxID=1632684 RepID=UPI001F08D90B|nr:CBO0543 family protein [Bacillus piscicola]